VHDFTGMVARAGASAICMGPGHLVMGVFSRACLKNRLPGALFRQQSPVTSMRFACAMSGSGQGKEEEMSEIVTSGHSGSLVTRSCPGRTKDKNIGL